MQGALGLIPVLFVEEKVQPGSPVELIQHCQEPQTERITCASVMYTGEGLNAASWTAPLPSQHPSAGIYGTGNFRDTAWKTAAIGELIALKTPNAGTQSFMV